MSNIQALPGAFPLHGEQNFLSESEWVIFRLLCRPPESFADAAAEELSGATGNQVSVERCDQLIRIVRIRQLPGLGSWIARIFAETGFSDSEIRELQADEITARVNSNVGYPLLNDATRRALASLQLQWKGSETRSDHNGK